MRDPFLPQEQRIEVLMFSVTDTSETYCSLELGIEMIQFLRPGTDLWSLKTEICQESNKAEIKDKFRSLKIRMASTERLLPPRTDRKLKSLNN